MIFFGGLAALLTVFFLGTLWPHKTKMPLGTALWGYFVKSLFLSWIWFLISYHTALGDIARLLVLAIIVIAIGFLISRKKIVLLSDQQIPFFSKFSDFAVVAIFLVLAMPALTGFGTIFTEWDSVASWNRWAKELARNEYVPMNAAYPVLWPAIWSLIYEAQGNSELWYIAKASIGAPLLFFVGYVVYKLKTGGLVSGVLLCALVFLAYVTQSKFVVSGYMDIPLALTGLVALLLTLDAIDADCPDQYREYLFLATITVSMAVLTKQGGLLIGGAVGALVFWDFLRKRLPFSYMIGLGAIVLLPALSYVQLFFSRQTSLWGNTDALLAVADKKRGEAGVFDHAYNVVFESIPELIIPLLLFGIILNLIFVRSRRGAFGLMVCAIGCVTFFIFAQCCAYGVRNSYFIFAFFITSAFVGYSSAEQWLTDRYNMQRAADLTFTEFDLARPLLLVSGAATIGLMALGIEWPENRLAEKHLKLQYTEMGSPTANIFIRNNRDLIQRYERFVTYYQMAQHFPETRKKYWLCPRTGKECIDGAVDRFGTLLVFSASWQETPETMKFIQNSLESGRAKELVKSGSYTLYEFRPQE